MRHIDGCPACFELLSLLTDIETPRELHSEELLPNHTLHIGRYQVIEQAGMGGVGVVYKTRDTKLKRLVAVKLLRPDILATDPEQAAEATQRLKREAQALATLDHPHIVTIYDIDTHEDQLFIACAFIEGENLREWLRSSARGWKEIVELFIQLAQALQAAHQVGIIHRDLKPENILVRNEDHALLTDFGMATHPTMTTSMGIDPGELATQQGMLLGTPAYMSPEQLDGQAPLPASDQFSFCVTLYEALYGFRPYHAPSYQELLQVLKQGQPVQPQSTTIPSGLFAILERGLLPRPDERYPSMQDLCMELARTLKPDTHVSSRTNTVMVACAMGVLLAGLFVAWSTHTPEHTNSTESVTSKGLTSNDTTSSPQPSLSPTKDQPTPPQEDLGLKAQDDPPVEPPQKKLAKLDVKSPPQRVTSTQKAPQRDTSKPTPRPSTPAESASGFEGVTLRPTNAIQITDTGPPLAQKKTFLNAVLALDGTGCQAIYDELVAEYPAWVVTHPKNYWRMRCKLLQGECKHMSTFDGMLAVDTPPMSAADITKHHYLYGAPSCFTSREDKLTQSAVRMLYWCASVGDKARCAKGTSILSKATLAAKLDAPANKEVIRALDYAPVIIKDCDIALHNLHAMAIAKLGGTQALTLKGIDDAVDTSFVLWALGHCSSMESTLNKMQKELGTGISTRRFLAHLRMLAISLAIQKKQEGLALTLTEQALDDLGEIPEASKRSSSIKAFERTLDRVWRQYSDSSCERAMTIWDRWREIHPSGMKYAPHVIARNRRNSFPKCAPKL